MLARVTTFALHGVDTLRVTVEVDLRRGLPAFSIVGLGDRAVRESRERVRAAVLNSGFDFPQRRVTVNLAPAHLRKEGPGFDLPIACGVLAASGQVPAEALERLAVFGELGLGGEVRPSRGALAVAEGARRHGFEGLVLPLERTDEASLVEDLEVLGAASLRDVGALLHGEPAATPPPPVRSVDTPGVHPDLTDVRGHRRPIRALVVAAAGGHNLLLSGPPGTGKTMLARRLPSILPELTRAEAIEVTRIHSIAGTHRGHGLIRERPFRAPHHSISSAGLVGGGAVPTPGEATLAHNGVLFLDELAEFNRGALEALRQPLEDGYVSIVRGQRAAIYPTRTMLVASTNPCPCGHLGSPRCTCSEVEVARYRRRLSGPLLDRMDLVVEVERPPGVELAADGQERSSDAREAVIAARKRQSERFAGSGTSCNADMDAGALRRLVRLGAEPRAVLRAAYERGTLTPRGHDRVLRVARTIADLAGSQAVAADHVHEALTFRHDAGHEPGREVA